MTTLCILGGGASGLSGWRRHLRQLEQLARVVGRTPR
jgi:hypothetical protein